MTLFYCTLDIDECEDNLCDENADCINTNGSHVCTCRQGFSGNGVVCEGAVLHIYSYLLALHFNSNC